MEEPFQPSHRFGVEVVGRLVQQQHVGAGKQEPTQRHPSRLAPRQRGDSGIARGAAQRIHRHLDGAVDLPRASGFDFFLQASLLRQQRLHLVRIAHFA